MMYLVHNIQLFTGNDRKVIGTDNDKLEDKLNNTLLIFHHDEK